MWNQSLGTKKKKRKTIFGKHIRNDNGIAGEKHIKERRINGKPGDLGKTKGQSFINEKG